MTQLIIGLGNRFMGDDGVGIHALEHLQRSTTLTVPLLDCGTDLLRAGTLAQPADQVCIIDAVRAGGPPGTIHWFVPEHVQESRNASSVHQLSLIENIMLLPLLNPDFSATQFFVIGVEPGEVKFTSCLSPGVWNAVHHVTQLFDRQDGFEQIAVLCERQVSSFPPKKSELAEYY